MLLSLIIFTYTHYIMNQRNANGKGKECTVILEGLCVPIATLIIIVIAEYGYLLKLLHAHKVIVMHALLVVGMVVSVRLITMHRSS